MRTVATAVLISCIGTMLFLQACNREYFKEIPVTKDVTFEKHIRPITSTVCISCHSSGSRDYSRYSNAYMMRHSLFQRIVVDKSMPMGKYLSDEDRALFRDWVNQGGQK